MAKGTSLKENIDMLKEEVVNFPKGRILHKGLNIIVEWVRANPKKAFFIGLAAWWLVLLSLLLHNRK